MLHFIQHAGLEIANDATLRDIVTRFDLSATQQQAWRAFEEAFCEVRDALEANAVLDQRERAPTLEEHLEMRSRSLAVELGAMRRLTSAASQLYRVLSPRQRASADRHLTALCRSLESAGRSLV